MMKRIWLSLIICLGIAGIPAVVLSAEITTSADVRSATAFATSKGYCEIKKDNRTADCLRQTTTCKADEWSKFVAANVEFIGGGIPQQKQSNKFERGVMDTDGELLPDSVYTFLRKDPRNRETIPPLGEAVCFCECPEGSTNPTCEGKQVGTPYRIGSDVFTREECVSLCSKSNSQIAGKCAGSLPALEQADAGSMAGQQAGISTLRSADALMLCFSQEECLNQKGTWEAYDQCQNGKGRCVAPEPIVQLNTAIGPVTSIAGFSNYIIVIFRYMLSIVVFLTTIMFVWGAFRYLVGSSMGNVGRGKAIMKDAVIGMILMLCSVLILRTINPATLKLNQVKMYMINTQQFIQTQYCKDLGSGTRLADAGIPPALKQLSEVQKSVTAYSETPKTADCGHAYYIKDSTAESTCQGLSCAEPNEICVSCASGIPTACQNVKDGKKKVCDKQLFAGSIDYQNERYPEQVYLVGVCGFAQTDPYGGSASSIVDANITIASEVDLAKTRVQVGNTATEESVAGNAMYSFKFDAGDIQKAINACPNGFRGFLLGVQYNDGDIAFDDVALLSKNNCSGGSALFDGYSTGGPTDKADLAQAFLCGLRKTPARFLDSSGVYWKRDELEAALAGRLALSCNFNLSDNNAPEDPGGKDPYCPVTAAKKQAVESTVACASTVKAGNICDTAGGSQACSLNGKICKCTPKGVGGTVVTSMWQCE